ncbi:hypothetical protein SORBI_3002G082700 [Sorghum bicolor]|uniref:Tubby C-terminal domain-containing protein n=1 Tax=Sorghum bicolor TaxID=4558 RepID=A0A1B6Q9W4_SORBI|nr:hypothetical protein SORBI_3002G082700 [Sorghum bicolor]
MYVSFYTDDEGPSKFQSTVSEPAPAPSPPVAVVTPTVHAPYTVPLAISLSGGDFVVTDANGALKYCVLSMHNRCEVFRGDNTDASDLLFTVKKASIFQKIEVDVFLGGNSAQQVCHFKIKGSYFERSFGFYLGNSDTMVAQINRKYTATNTLLGKGTFVVTVFPHVDYVFIAALVVILDEIHRERFD